MNIDWLHLLQQGRWDALVMLWHGVLIDAQTYWWFGPLLIVIAIVIGRKGLLRLLSYVAKVFVHTHNAS